VSGLLSPVGRALLDELRGEDVTPDRALALSAGLRGRYPAELVAAGLTQQALRAAARAKFGRAQEMLFTRDGLEQASSDLTAGHAARRLAGFGVVADLCCGIGGNLAALAGQAPVLAVDRDLATLELARHNAAACGAVHPVALVCADVLRLGRLPKAVFIDPARRAGGRRLATGASEPPLGWCLSLAERAAVGIKAAPGLDRALVPAGWEAEFVAVGRDLKEALLWSPALATAARRATVLPGGDTLVPEPGAALPVAAPGEWLLDPNPAVTRAGLVAELGRRLGAWQIDPMIAFLSCDAAVSTPFARTLRVLESMPWHERRAAARLRALGIGSADIRRRGLAGDVDLIRRRLGLRAGAGGRTAVIVLTRREDRPWGLICVAA
jgi:SAM-dependent methyltransferase